METETTAQARKPADEIENLRWYAKLQALYSPLYLLIVYLGCYSEGSTLRNLGLVSDASANFIAFGAVTVYVLFAVLSLWLAKRIERKHSDSSNVVYIRR